MKFLPLALAALVVGADALLTNPVKNVKKIQVYAVVVVVVVILFVFVVECFRTVHFY